MCARGVDAAQCGAGQGAAAGRGGGGGRGARADRRHTPSI